VRSLAFDVLEEYVVPVIRPKIKSRNRHEKGSNQQLNERHGDISQKTGELFEIADVITSDPTFVTEVLAEVVAHFCKPESGGYGKCMVPKDICYLVVESVALCQAALCIASYS
jgi:hypothetical protein